MARGGEGDDEEPSCLYVGCTYCCCSPCLLTYGLAYYRLHRVLFLCAVGWYVYACVGFHRERALVEDVTETTCLVTTNIMEDDIDGIMMWCSLTLLFNQPAQEGKASYPATSRYCDFERTQAGDSIQCYISRRTDGTMKVWIARPTLDAAERALERTSARAIRLGVGCVAAEVFFRFIECLRRRGAPLTVQRTTAHYV